MNKGIIEEFNSSFNTAFIDSTATSNLAYRPQFVSNNYREGKKVLSSIEDELRLCDHFRISVAFITMSGITPLLVKSRALKQQISDSNIKVRQKYSVRGCSELYKF